MRTASLWLILSAAALALAGAPERAVSISAMTDVVAGAPSDLSVTIYRGPAAGDRSFNLDRLDGFALVSETRTVHLPAGESRLRFEGVADGIDPASAIVSGLPSTIIEKNRDSQLLSPAALLAAGVDRPLAILRTDKKTGKTERLPGTLKSDADGGVVYETAQGIEGLRCSGLPETVSFSSALGLSATPTLSVLVRSREAMTATVTLSYLARGFDWAADYVATLSPDGKTVDLGAWATLVNGNGVGFPRAHTQVVAGRLNRERGIVEPVDAGSPILAQCWPRGSTSDSPDPVYIVRASPWGAAERYLRNGGLMQPLYAEAPSAVASVVVTGHRVEQEQLGDLKLYRVPERATVASRQSKQVRLLDRSAIPVQLIYGADLAASANFSETPDSPTMPAKALLRTKNTASSHLGLPLPSGRIAVFAVERNARVLLHESNLRDLAVGEDVEIDMGTSSDVRVKAVKESTAVDTGHAELLPLIPGIVAVRSLPVDEVHRVEITNARGSEIAFELRLQLPTGARVIRADHSMGSKNGRPIFSVTIPANGSAMVHYQTQQTDSRATVR